MPLGTDTLDTSLSCRLELEPESRRMRSAAGGMSTAFAKIDFNTALSSSMDDIDKECTRGGDDVQQYQ
jgi:hypothetical protein